MQSFVAGDKTFLLNGKPFIVRAAELHYPRIPKEYWEHRIQMCKAMGMNTICIYLFWNFHEQQKGKYDFTGNKDIVAFIKLIQKNGMYCIVRPGPYVCAEWDMGGLPWWLLKKDQIKVRTLEDKYFMESTSRYFKKVGELLSPLQIQNGGNIIMAQVENEYGVWGNDGDYMAAIRDQLRASGLDKVQLFRCDWSSNFNNYQLEGVLSTLNFSAGSDVDAQFKKFKEVNPNSPLMCSEYWTGWFDAWGSPHQTRGINSFIGSLKDMMDRGISFSLYMAHGGTSFGQWAGSNAPPFSPDVSSYDYNAPIDEGGNATDKFFAIRDLLKNYLNPGEILADIPNKPIKIITIPLVRFDYQAQLFSNLPASKKSFDIRPMEYFDQGWGSIVYRTKITPSKQKRKINITDVHDWAAIYIDGRFIGSLDRRLKDKTITIPPVSKEAVLDILIETNGRVNFSEAIIDRKGITKNVDIISGLDTTRLNQWQVFNLPVDYDFQKEKKYIKKIQGGPGWYKSQFALKQVGDTYLDMSAWGKGMVWINGHNLGRFWNIGPAQTLYLPRSWLKEGNNEVIIREVGNPLHFAVKGIDSAILDKIELDSSRLHRKPGLQLDLSSSTAVHSGTLTSEGSWQQIMFDKVHNGRFFCLEALNAHDPKDRNTSIAELVLIDENGKPLSTMNWSVKYADSENLLSAQTADKVFDNQESVIWSTWVSNVAESHPHHIVIDLGENKYVKGFRILQRNDRSKAGMIKDYKTYLSKEAFPMKKSKQ
jgi:beta-galactosidase